MNAALHFLLFNIRNLRGMPQVPSSLSAPLYNFLIKLSLALQLPSLWVFGQDRAQ